MSSAVSDDRSEVAPSRSMPSADGRGARTRSIVHTAATTTIQSSTVDHSGLASTVIAAMAATATSRPVTTMSARHGDGAQDRVENAVRRHALELCFGAKLDAVAPRRLGNHLDVIGRDEVTCAEPGPRSTGGE